jgi:hypothetical protein
MPRGSGKSAIQANVQAWALRDGAAEAEHLLAHQARDFVEEELRASGPSVSPIVVEPTTSAMSTVTILRSPAGSAIGGLCSGCYPPP